MNVATPTNAGGMNGADIGTDFPLFWGWVAWVALAMVLPRLPAVSATLARRSGGWWLLLGALGCTGAGLGFFAGSAADTPGLLGDALRLPWWLAALVWWEGVTGFTGFSKTAVWARAPRWLAAELALLLIAVELAGGGGVRPGWFFPVEWAWRHLPAGLALAGVVFVWRGLDAEPDRARRGWLRAAMLGLGGAFALPGLAAVALIAAARVAWEQAAMRGRPALWCACGVLVFAMAAPGLAELNEARAAAGREEVRLRRAAARVESEESRALAEDPPAWLRTAALELRGEGAERIRLWRTRAGTWEWLDPGQVEWTLGAGPAPGPAERTAGGRAFVLAGEDAEIGDTTIHAPLRPSRFASPTAWMELRYPKAGDAEADRTARRGGLGLAGALATACALGFVFACRQAEGQAQLLALGRAEAASRAKSEFLAFLSHELRTPLQTILGRAGLLIRSGDTNTVRQATAIKEQGRLMLRLVGDLLDLGAVEAGRLELRPTVFSLRERLEVVRAELVEAAVAKGLRLELQVAEDVPEGLRGDETRLRQIVANLWGNAVRHTPAGWARLEVRREPAVTHEVALSFRITDSGPGLPADKLSRLFTLFTRLDAGGDFRREGTGVGLALVRRLCDLMGGSVTAGNLPEGGAEFIARLAFSPSRMSGGVETRRVAPVGRKRVLVADDNVAARAYLLEAVRALGHEAEAVGDGGAALRAALAGGWDVLLLDVNMPGMDGIAVARALRDRPGRPRLIACSAEAFARTRAEAVAAGMEAFLAKPVDLEVLASALGEAAGEADARCDGDVFSRLAESGAAEVKLGQLMREEWADWRRSVEGALASGDPQVWAGLVHRWRSHALLLRDEMMCAALDELLTAPDEDAARAALERIAERVEFSAGSGK